MFPIPISPDKLVDTADRLGAIEAVEDGSRPGGESQEVTTAHDGLLAYGKGLSSRTLGRPPPDVKSRSVGVGGTASVTP